MAFYPVVTAALWIAGGLVFWAREEYPRAPPDQPASGVTVLIPAFNESAVIETCVRAVLRSDYERFELIVLDDGSTDDTAEVARRASDGDERCEVISGPLNHGKAAQLNRGFARARYPLVVVTDADTHIHPEAIAFLVQRIESSALLAAVAGAPHVTNRGHFLANMQILEAAAIIGLIRRAQAVTGRVGTVAGVLGIFRRDLVVAVGGFREAMATEDIDLSWRLLLDGWQTSYEPRALVGMEVPTTLPALWNQRKRWARGQGEVMRVHLGQLLRPRNHRMWLVGLESVASLVWVLAMGCATVLALLTVLSGQHGLFGFGLAWGVAVCVVAMLQLAVALPLSSEYEHWPVRSTLLAPVYPVLFWLVSAAAALRAQVGALVRGPRETRVVWDIPREVARGE